jgi:hypothetical protein
VGGFKSQNLTAASVIGRLCRPKGRLSNFSPPTFFCCLSFVFFFFFLPFPIRVRMTLRVLLPAHREELSPVCRAFFGYGAPRVYTSRNTHQTTRRPFSKTVPPLVVPPATTAAAAASPTSKAARPSLSTHTAATHIHTCVCREKERGSRGISLLFFYINFFKKSFGL